MSYKPQKKVNTGSFGGPSGVAKVLFRGEDRSKAKIVLDEKSYVFEDFPKFLESGDFFVRLSSEADKILSAYPATCW